MPSRTRSAGSNMRTQDDDAQYVLIIVGMPSRSDWQELKDFLRKTLVIRYVRRVEVYRLNIEGIGCGTFDVRGTRDAYRCYEALRNFGYNNYPVSVGLLREDGSEYQTLERSIKVKYTARTTGPARVRLLPPSQPAIQSTLQPAIESFLRESMCTQPIYHTMPPNVYPMVSPVGPTPAQTVTWNSAPSAPGDYLISGRSYEPTRPNQRPIYADTTPRVISRAPNTMSGIAGQTRPSQTQAPGEHVGISASSHSTGVTTTQGTMDSTALAQRTPHATYTRRRVQAAPSRGSSTSARSPRNSASNHLPRPQAPEFFPFGTTEPSNGPLICDGSANSFRRSRYVPDSDDDDNA